MNTVNTLALPLAADQAHSPSHRASVPSSMTWVLGGLVWLLVTSFSSNAHAGQCQLAVVDDWNSGYKAEITITNDGDTAITDWTLSWQLGEAASFNSGWRAQYQCSGQSCTATPPSWGPTIHVGGAYTFGFIVNQAGGSAGATIQVAGDICAGSTAHVGPLHWQLDGTRSKLQYVSMKKDHTAETNGFVAADSDSSALQGSIDETGQAIFAVDLNAVATGVDIRNSRLQAFLFETDFLPTAWFRTQLDLQQLQQLDAGAVQQQTLTGDLSLHGVRQAVTAQVLVARLSDSLIKVSTVQPLNIASSSFDMAAGIETLRVIANLSSIGEAVPVYFDLYFVANTDPDATPLAMPEAPADPSDLTGTFDAATAQAQLQWQDNSDNETLYLLRRRLVDSAWQTVDELAANVSSLTEGLPDTGEFDYKVIAINDGVPSLPSNIERVAVTESSPLVRGQHLYEAQCAACHGSEGEGISTFPPLNTERNLEDMIAYIQQFMPFGDAGACDQSCAEDVSTFIETFWVTEPVCDVGLTPVSYGARQLKILTNREYQNSVQDLLGVDFEVADGLSADTTVGLFTNNTHASVVATSYSNFLLVAEQVAEWAAGQNFAPALSCAVVDEACADQLLEVLAPRVFRRPLTADEIATYQAIAYGDHTDGDIQQGMQLALQGLLAAPQFLYRHELGELNPANAELDADAYELTSYEMATFLAYTFTGSTPDQQLLDAAAADELRDDANIISHAQRLAGNAQGVLGDFVGDWLGTADLASAAKDSAAWPGFAEVVPHMQAEVNQTFAHIMLEPDEQFATLYAGSYTFLNETLANHYGLSGVAGDVLQQVGTADRGGILAGGAFMARWGEAVESSPILRSVRVRRRILCQDQPDPPAGTFAAREEKLTELAELLADPATTNRLKYHRLTEDVPCSNCHMQYINPLGFGMEDFDTVGRVRTADLNGNPVDASGELYAPTTYSNVDEVVSFHGSLDLGAVLANLPAAQSCLPKQMFRYVMGVGHNAIDPDNPDGPQLSEAEQSSYACQVEQLTNTMMNNGPRAMFEAFGSLQAVRYRKAWVRE